MQLAHLTIRDVLDCKEKRNRSVRRGELEVTQVPQCLIVLNTAHLTNRDVLDCKEKGDKKLRLGDLKVPYSSHRSASSF